MSACAGRGGCSYPRQAAAGTPCRNATLMSAMKDEGPFALEFIAHHRAIGSTRSMSPAILQRRNRCFAGSARLAGAITHTHSRVAPGERPQRKAYDIREAPGWTGPTGSCLMWTSFLSRPAPGIADLTAQAGPEVDVICLSALGRTDPDDPHWHPGRVTARFTQRVAADSLSGSVKSLSRGGALARHPEPSPGRLSRRRDDHGDARRWQPDEVPNARQDICGISGQRIAHGLGWYQHYPIKTPDSSAFARCAAAGRARGSRRAALG